MRHKTRTVAEELALPAAAGVQTPAPAPMPPPPAPVAALVAFTYAGEPWRCARFDELAAEFGLAAAALPDFWAALQARERSALLVRRLYGVTPVIPPAGATPEDWRVWERGELQAALGLTRAQLQDELDAARGHWQALSARAEVGLSAAPAAPREFREELAFTGDDLLRELGLDHLAFDSVAERDWFSRRVREWERLLREKMVSGLARECLTTELMLRQVERELSRRENIGGSEWARLAKTKQELQESYRRGLDQLETLAPYAREVAGKYGLQGVISDITLAHQEYVSRGTTQLRDGIYTAAEIEVMLRMTLLRPEPQYRLGHVAALNLARAGLLDPTWQQTMRPAMIRRIDAGFTGGFIAASAADGAMPVDIEADGPEGEYEPLGLEPATETL